MQKRREFIKLTAFSGFSTVFSSGLLAKPHTASRKENQAIVISTWNHGREANKEAWKILVRDGHALDAVEAGVRVSESDPEVSSVGLGGLPDRDGHVTLDACIMDHQSQCGSVSFLQHIENPISVARKVMEETPHIMLSGEGALEFAINQGFKKVNLLTENSKKRWERWLEESKYKPTLNIENHDTIGMLALDHSGNLSGACTTSGLAYKLHGRVGDSPIIGAGLFVDGEIGAACATGIGEAVIRVAGSAIVVELMRQGKSPEEACRIVVERIIDKHKHIEHMQVGFIAMNRDGAYGGFSIYNGFNYALRTPTMEKMVDAPYKLKN